MKSVHNYLQITKIIFVVLTMLSTLLTFYNTITIKAQSNSSSNNLQQLQELIPNHNIKNSDRINLVFNVINNKEYNINDLVTKNLVDLIGWNGPILTKDNEGIIEIKRGFFATDPVRDYKNKFNIWLRYQKDTSIDSNIDYNNLKNKVIITIGNYDFGTSYLWKYAKEDGTIPYINIFNRPKELIQSDNFGFVLTHELGHALFSFDDEYESIIGTNTDYRGDESESTKDEVYQNIQNNKKCVEQMSVKPKYFNQLDPMYYEVLQDYKDLGVTKTLNKENFEITYYKKDICSGKYSVNDIDNFGATNSTIYSIMEGANDNNYNIWTSLKKQEIITFLNQFKGAGDNIKYIKKIFTPKDYEYIKNTPYKDLYKENLKLVDNAYFNRQVNKSNSSLSLINPYVTLGIVLSLGIVVLTCVIYIFFLRKVNNLY